MIDPEKYGVSFSIKQCRNFGLDSEKTLAWLLKQGWRRFRLMSYWNEIEKTRGEYDFSELDRQITQVRKKDGVVTLCLGVKQPRWPEYHWPTWTRDLNASEKTEALLSFLEVVVTRYRQEKTVISYQLENEALLSNFGRDIDIDRRRLRREYTLIRRLDPDRPIYMSTSNGWGVPLRRPLPWGVGFSVYTTMFQKGAYRTTVQKPWLHRLRAWFIRWVLQRPVFIHELQCEPWGHDAIWKMTLIEQDRSMGTTQIRRNIDWAQSIRAYPIDLWGAEWWYWRWLQGDKTIYHAVQEAISDS